MVYQWQTIFYEKRYSSTTPHRKTDFVKLAEGFGAKGYHTETLEEFRAAFGEAKKADGPVWIEVMIEPEERVLPMIPGGKTVEEIILD
jgi:acetolactate synthase-1/2/3 large subunit